MKVMDGKMVSQLLRDNLALQIQELKQNTGWTSKLSVILVGDNPASQVYVQHKSIACKKVGIDSEVIQLPSSVSKEELKNQIEKLNQDSKTNGILIQLPLPDHLNTNEVLSWINPMKDPDCLTPENIGLFFSSQERVQPCTPKGILLLLEHYKISVKGKNAVVIGRSQIVGKPMAQLLLDQQATVTVCHSKTKDLKQHTKEADILVVACGQHHLVKSEHCKKGAVVIDVGIHRIEKEAGVKLEGDVCPDQMESLLEYLSPVPGGVGPMTIVSLLINTFELTKKQQSL